MAGRSEGGWKHLAEKSGREKYNYREEWKKLLITARNHRILHMPME
jgi:hypothetical protein